MDRVAVRAAVIVGTGHTGHSAPVTRLVAKAAAGVVRESSGR